MPLAMRGSVPASASFARESSAAPVAPERTRSDHASSANPYCGHGSPGSGNFATSWRKRSCGS
jgi:hypothetical protein